MGANILSGYDIITTSKQNNQENKMKVFIVAIEKKDHKVLANLGQQLHANSTKSREKAEKVAKAEGGEVYSIIIDDTLKLVADRTYGLVYKEAKRIGAI